MEIASDPFLCTILGEPASKANSRRVVQIRQRIAVVKSKKAIEYLKVFKMQCPIREPLLTEDVAVGMKIWYASRRPDLDESLILDALQGYAYKNDRQVKIKFILWGLAPDRPRTDIIVVPTADFGLILHYFKHHYASTI